MNLDDALAKPTPDEEPGRPGRGEVNAEVRVDGLSAEVVVTNARQQPSLDEEGHEALRTAGLDPREWRAIRYNTSTWTMGNGGEGNSARWGFERKPDERPSPPGPPWEDLETQILHRPAPSLPVVDGDHGFVVALGDMQFGKIDGDGAQGTLSRVLSCLDQARASLDLHRQRYPVGHVHVAWLGDHVEGFVSQGGANVWRTPLTLNEQIRLTRRVMLHALQLFADCGVPRLSMAAVPGNHGEPQRFQGKGVTRYDDSHDTEALIAVSDAAHLDPVRFGHAKFYVPETDELTLTVNVAGTLVAHAHGHQWRSGKHFDWWRGQAFGTSTFGSARLLLAGHLHHLHVDTDGNRMFVQIPALESESTWWRHQTGTGGDPGIVVALTRDGVTPILEVVRARA